MAFPIRNSPSPTARRFFPQRGVAPRSATLSQRAPTPKSTWVVARHGRTASRTGPACFFWGAKMVQQRGICQAFLVRSDGDIMGMSWGYHGVVSYNR